MTCMVFINSKVKLFNVESNDGKTNYKVGDNFVKMYDDKKLEENVQDIKDRNNRTPTPKLLTHTHSVPYNENFEVRLAEKERLRCLSRGSSLFTGSASDTSEIHKIFKKRKKSGHNWTRRKGAKSTPRSFRSTSRKRTVSNSTNSSFSNSCYSRRRSGSRRRSPSASLIIRGRLSSRWTRSVSRAHEEENQYMSSLFHCSVEECNMECDNVDKMNQHNIDEHQMLLNHYCYECKQVYTSATLLALHREDHYSSSVYCLMCGIEQSNTRELQKHLDDHMVYSVPCKYCDKSFLSKSIREKHVETCHKGRRRRQILRDKLIIDRIDKNYYDKDTTF